MKLFEAINVWRRTKSGAAIQYRCFRVNQTENYCVQSADYHSTEGSNAQQFEKQFVELFVEQAPDERSKVFPSLEEAITNFDRDFGNKWL